MTAPFRLPAPCGYPRLWSETHVAHWLYWAIREFSLEGVPLNQFHMRGKDICAMGKEAFLARAPPFMGDILWEHLEILQKGTYRSVGGGDMYGEDTSGEHHYILHKVKYISAVGALRLATLVSGAENDVTSPPTPSRDNMWGHRLVEQVERQSTSIVPLAEVLRLEAGNQRHLGPEVVAAQLCARQRNCTLYIQSSIVGTTQHRTWNIPFGLFS
uniref:PNT domain-containing protein n=1 Tax=Timema shepardi TaxID=629360 RepID=A0A7R9FYL8_TIMSH|nr:unnamed protein product [Timema shepardi]